MEKITQEVKDYGKSAKAMGESITQSMRDVSGALKTPYKTLLENLNDKIDSELKIQQKYPSYSNAYKKALEREIELLKEKKSLLDSQSEELEEIIETK